MYRLLVTIMTLIVGFFALLFGLLLAIPLALMALISGKRLEWQLRRRPFHQAHNNESDNIIEGEFEEVSRDGYRSEHHKDNRD